MLSFVGGCEMLSLLPVTVYTPLPLTLSRVFSVNSKVSSSEVGARHFPSATMETEISSSVFETCGVLPLFDFPAFRTFLPQGGRSTCRVDLKETLRFRRP